MAKGRDYFTSRAEAQAAAREALGDGLVAGVHFVTTENKPGQWGWEPVGNITPHDAGRTDYSRYAARPGINMPKVGRPGDRGDMRVHRGSFTAPMEPDEPEVEVDLFGPKPKAAKSKVKPNDKKPRKR